MNPESNAVDLRSLVLDAAKKLQQAKAELARLKRDRNEPLAVVGVGCRFPGEASTPKAFWGLLVEGRDAITEVPEDRWSLAEFHHANPEVPGKMTCRHGGFVKCPVEFDAAFFGIAPREAVMLDPQQRLLLEVAWEALENAAIAPEQIAGTRTGVFVGICSVDYYQRILARGTGEIDEYLGAGVAHSMAAGRLAYLLGLHGPAFAVDTACSSSLLSVHLACQSLRGRESDVAIAGGVNLLLSPETSISFSKARMVSPDGRCKTFDSEANGYVRGEGCGMVVLKRLSDAIRDGDPVWAVVCGSAVNHDGRTSGLTVPNGPAQERVIREALANAGVEPGDVQYVEAHGTGTSLGDPIELGALGAVFGPGRASEQPLLVGSVKTNLGHLEGAAGIAGFIKTVLALHWNRIPPHLHFKKPNLLVDWSGLHLAVPANGAAWPCSKRTAGVSSLGFSGTNVHVVLQAAPELRADTAEWGGQPAPQDLLLVLSARSAGALRELAGRYLAMFETLPNRDYPIVCAQSNFGRAQMEHRVAFMGVEPRELREQLRTFVGRGTARYSGETTLEQAEDLALPADALVPVERLAAGFVQGATIPWTRVYPGLRRVVLDLPNYPFQRKRFWIESARRSARSARILAWEVVWKNPTSRHETRLLSGAWLLVARPGRQREQVAGALRAGGAELVAVDDSSGMDAAIIDRAWAGMVFLHPSGGRWCSARVDGFESGTRELLATVQNLIRSSIPGRGRLWVITSGAVSVAGEPSNLEQAAIHGLCKVIGMEHPALFGAVLDLDPGEASSARLDGLLPELAGEAGEPVVAWRSGRRFVPRLIGLAASAPSEFRCSPDASYLVTGGLGGVGSRMADWLVQRGAGRVFITTRGSAPQASPGSRVSARTVDLTSRESVADLFAEIQSCGAPLRGILHCAGGVDDGLLEGQTWDRCARVLAPKIEGSWRLHEAAKDMPLDFFVLSSSITSLFGSMGQGSYAAASAFQDALAQYRRSRGLPGLSINWGPWADVGMAARLGARERRRISAQGVHEILAGEALEALGWAIGSQKAQIAIVEADWAVFVRESPGGKPVPLLDELVAKDESRLKGLAVGTRLELGGITEFERREIVSNLVIGEVAASLGLDEVEVRGDGRGFFALGMDSLMSLRLKSSLELRTGLTLPATLAFEYSNCVDLTAYLAERLGVAGGSSLLKGQGLRPLRSQTPNFGAAVPGTFEGLSEVEIDQSLSKRLENL